MAVLEFEVAKGLDLDRTYYSDKVRGSIQDRAPQLFVMTRESTEVLLKQFGKTLAECTGECEVETGKKLGADFVVSGRITRAGSRLALTMRLHATATGELLKTAEALGKDADALVDGADAAVATLLVPLVGEAPSAPPAAGPGPSASPAPAQGVLKVVSAPAGAKVSIDGDAAGSTPLSVKKDAGTYVVSIELPGYAPVSRQVDLAAGKTAVVNEKLMQAAGYLDVSISPQAAAQLAHVTVDGAAAGVGKQGPYKVGSHAVRAEAAGYKPVEQSAAVDNGGTTLVQFALEALPGKLLISVNVAASCSAGGASVKATPDGVARLEVPAGSLRVTCSADGHDDASADVDVAPGKAMPVKLALKRGSAGEAGGGGMESKSGLPFVSIPAGTFQYQGERSVSVKAFRLGASAVTVAAYKKCVDAGACAKPNTGSGCNWDTDRTDHPVNCVDWNQATAFCKWIGGRLPTEEEREYVASGGSEGRTYPWGNEVPGARACWDGEGSDLGKGNRKTTCAVGSHKAGDSRLGPARSGRQRLGVDEQRLRGEHQGYPRELLERRQSGESPRAVPRLVRAIVRELHHRVPLWAVILKS